MAGSPMPFFIDHYNFSIWASHLAPISDFPKINIADFLACKITDSRIVNF